jgi:RimJ/RimL family protein N-acetyltransferase
MQTETVLDTPRLRLRRLTPDDAPFILELLNDPSFIRFIGDRGVRTIDDARGYIARGPAASYARFGFGLYLVELTDRATPIGICGLLKRDALPDPDIGFAFLPEYRRRGFAFESARAVRDYALGSLGLPRILAITDPENAPSIRLLGKLRFVMDRTIVVADGEPELQLFACDRS